MAAAIPSSAPVAMPMWRPLDASPREVRRRELVQRLLMTVAVICVLPILCALLLLPFFYYTAAEPALASIEPGLSRIYSLPEYEKAVETGDGAVVYEWLRLADPRQQLLPDTRAGFSKFLQFQPHYGAEPFPAYQSARPAVQPHYDELFSRIAPQFPHTIVNEQIHQLWQRMPAGGQPTPPLQVRPGAQRPVWRLADGTPVPSDEEPVLDGAVMEYWRTPELRSRLARRLQTDSARTQLEIQVLPPQTIPQLLPAARTTGQEEPKIAIARVALRKSCGDSRLDAAAAAALQGLLEKRANATAAAPPGYYGIQVDWGCW